MHRRQAPVATLSVIILGRSIEFNQEELQITSAFLDFSSAATHRGVLILFGGPAFFRRSSRSRDSKFRARDQTPKQQSIQRRGRWTVKTIALSRLHPSRARDRDPGKGQKIFWCPVMGGFREPLPPHHPRVIREVSSPRGCVVGGQKPHRARARARKHNGASEQYRSSPMHSAL